MQLEIVQIGDEAGLILPQDLLTRLGMTLGDTVTVTESPDGTITIALHETDDDKTMRIARAAMQKYAATLRALADS